MLPEIIDSAIETSGLQSVETAENITVDGQLLKNGSIIGTSTQGAGNVGAITVHATEVLLEGPQTRIISKVDSGIGNGGTIAMDIDNHLQLLNGGVIDVSAFSAGAGGSALIRAGSLLIDGQGGGFFTGIASQAASGSTGNGGVLGINVEKQLQILNEGTITASSLGAGDAGTIFINAPEAIEAFLDASGIQLIPDSGYTSNIGSIESGAYSQSAVILSNDAYIST